MRMAKRGAKEPGIRVATWAVTSLELGAALLSLSACGGEARGTGSAVVRDSAGVTIVENAPDAEVPEWQVGPDPLVEIGGDLGDPSQELYRVRAAHRLPDGRIVVANGGTQELRFYGAAGSFLHATGGEGEGPGEFENLYFLQLLGADSLLAFDLGNRRVSVFDADGEYARSFPLALPDDGLSFPWPQGLAGPDGRRLVVRDGSAFRAGEAESGLSRDSVTYHLVDVEGEGVRSLGRFPGSEYWVRSTETMMSVRAIPFARSPRFAASDSGFYQGSTDAYDIGYFGLDGELRGRIRLLRAPRPVTDADRTAYRDAQLAEADEEDRPERERTLREIPYPETMPIHDALHVDALGHLWVQEYRPEFEEGPARWRVFGLEGSQVAVVELPGGGEMYQIGEEFILGRWQDDFDLEYVRLYPLDRRGGRP